MLELVGQACQVHCLAAASEQAAVDIVAVGQLGVDLLDCIAEPAAGNSPGPASAYTVAVDIALEEAHAVAPVVAAAVASAVGEAWPVTASTAGQALLPAHTAFAAAAAGH